MKNYITPEGYNALSERLSHLLNIERPKIIKIVSWAAGNGDRSENADYIYGKKHLRQINNEILRITKSLKSAIIVTPRSDDTDQIFFGCFVTIMYKDTKIKKNIRIVGVDEIDTDRNYISWQSPLSKALLGRCCNDSVSINTPDGKTDITIISISYSSPY
ncbi:transcription elongation factor GreB [Candidatus Ichthyocystis sparus]|nr:transcription elongation factor GreB [Candidatus Ichthyocystis sparus]